MLSKRLKLSQWLIFLSLLSLFGCSQVQPNKDSQVDDEITGTLQEDIYFPEQNLTDETLDRLEDTRDHFSHYWHSTASNIDLYLSKHEESEGRQHITESYMRFTLEQKWRETQGFETDSRFKVRLHLPLTEKKWKLFMENNLDDKETLASQQSQTILDSHSNDIEKGFFAGFERRRFLHRWRLKRRIGIRFGLPLQPFVSFSVNRNFSLEADWRANVHNQIFYYHTAERGSSHSLTFIKPLNPSRTLRIRTAARWLDNDDTWETTQTFFIQKNIDKKRMLLHSVGVASTNRPNSRAERYFINTLFRKTLYKDWLFGELSPELHWHREDNFNPRWLFIGRLEVLFDK